jgi:hypothetical protein
MRSATPIASFGASVFFVAVLLNLSSSQVSGATPTLLSADLTPYMGVHRLVLVFPGNGPKEEAFLDQWDSPSVQSRMEHRSLLIFQVRDRALIEKLRSSLAPEETGFRVWLIGRSGHLVFSTSRDLEPWEIFSRIDVMPGRQREIRQHNDWDAGRQASP